MISRPTLNDKQLLLNTHRVEFNNFYKCTICVSVSDTPLNQTALLYFISLYYIIFKTCCFYFAQLRRSLLLRRKRELVFNPLVVFGLLSHLWCSRSKWPDSKQLLINLSLCYIITKYLIHSLCQLVFFHLGLVLCFYLHLINRRPHLSESRHLIFCVKKAFFMNNFHNMR